MELRKREGAESAKKPLDAKARRKRKDEREPETDDGKARNSRALLRISRSNLSDFAASLPSRFRVKENFALSPTFAFSGSAYKCWDRFLGGRKPLPCDRIIPSF